MNGPARRVRFMGEGEYRNEAEALLKAAGDIAAVVRVRRRSLIMSCPDGCGTTIVINLDPRAGKAWQIDMRKGAYTLYPSVWLDDGCRSHFVLWRDHIVWCDRFTSDNVEPPYDAVLEGRVLAALDFSSFKSAPNLAAELDELTWDVDRVLRILARRGQIEEGAGPLEYQFRRL